MSPARDTWSGIPRVRDLARDAVDGARAQRTTTLTLAVVLAVVCFAVLVTTGQSAASEARIVEQIDSAGTRLIALSDDGGKAGIQATAPHRLAGLSDTTWAFGLGEAVDVTNPALPDGRAASRAVVGDLPADLAIVQGRPPRPGEAIAGTGVTAVLHLGPGLGTIRPIGAPGEDPVAVVGAFEATGPLAHLNDVILIAAAPEDAETLRYVYVMADDVAVIDRLEAVLRTSTPALDPSALTVETPAGAIALRDVIAGRLGAASRQLMAVVMGVGAAIIAVTMASATASRRRDFGRRRALGATRSALVATTLAQSSLGALAGIVVGTAAGVVTLAATTGSLPSWWFVAGVAGLALLLTVTTATPIATRAAHRDPLRILRVP
ncbi:FtsX-like permease family protein [Xylanimonas protaetiae]|uniref:FtsX-like permease family protein n=1 Tax=Xylanimonas protaetiae TaxID=2509457 RepID=A0A4P6FL96_9MICO|nr:FtsX-like permease family protein [Xylanimonas protaetiae]QAY71408.1 FtsX-like permease family protein [Xylanimonas protaetiae]